MTAGPSIQNSQTILDALSTVETTPWQRVEVAPGGTLECPGILNCFEGRYCLHLSAAASRVIEQILCLLC